MDQQREELMRRKAQRERVRRQKQRRALVIFCLTVVVIVTGVVWVRVASSKRAVSTSVAKQAKTAGAAAENQFASYPNYESENQDRYRAYAKLHSDLAPKDVIWRVNQRLDLTLFDDAEMLTEQDLNDDLLIIVNKYHRVPDDYTPDDLTDTSDGCSLRAVAAHAFDQMKEAAAQEGYTLRAVSGFRSVAYQDGLYQGYLAQDTQAEVDRYSARAGYSEHHTGLAVDVFGSIDGLNEFETTPEYQWVKENGAKYGFIIRYTTQWEGVTGYLNEPWHLRYVGEKAAKEMKENNIGTLEEYRDRYVLHQPE